MMRRALLVLAITMLFAPPAGATDYYISAEGRDGARGTSSAEAWETLARLRTIRLLPGDRVLLRGGDEFWGSIALDPDEPGSPAAPIVITSYGTGRATIRSGDGTAIAAYNVAGYRVANLVLIGSGSTNVGSGIHFYSDRTDGVLLPYIRIENVEASSYGGYGVLIGSAAGSGYRDVRLTGIRAHHNAQGGIFTYAGAPNTHRDVYVGYSVAHDNPGIPGALNTTGNGILLGGVNGGTIERCVAFGNGRLNNYSSGPVGIWTYDSRAVVIQFNESHHNRTGGTKDGGGFGLDQNTSDSILQYNYSHDNDGAGYLLAMRYGTHTHTNNIVRYNISQNDSRKVGYGAIHLWGGIRNAAIYNNTVFLAPAPAGTPYVFLVKSSSYTSNDLYNVRVLNNIFQTSGGARLVNVASSQLDGAVGFELERNVYFTGGAAFTAVWSGTTYTSFSSWRAASGVESSGLLTDPQLTSPGLGPSYDDARLLHALDAYRLRPGSPLVDRGLDLTQDGIHTGGRDFYGTALPHGGGYDIGADEGGGVCGGAGISPTSRTHEAVASRGSFTVNAPGECAWSAVSSATWLRTTPLTGHGSATVAYQLDANEGTRARTARVTVAGATLTITQAAGLALTAPNGGERLFTGSPYLIEWQAASAARFDLAVSVDGGATYQNVPGCTGLSGAARSCTWASPGPVTSTGRLRVTATYTSGATLADSSDASFTILSGAPSITVTTPNASGTNWGLGSSHSIKWSHNLGSASYVDVDVSRDGGTSWEPVALRVKNGSTSGSTLWRVTEPLTTQARVRVRWSHGFAADSSDHVFTIAPPYITVASPGSSTSSWGYGTARPQTWSTNLGPGDRVRLRLSTDGGATFPLTLGEGTASARTLTVFTPTLGAPTSAARVRVEWTAQPDVHGTNPAAFRVEPAYVIVTRPDLSSHGWTAGTTGTTTWSHNLGSSESVALELSTDGGATYAHVLAAGTPSDGSHGVTVQSAWTTAAARVRVRWLKDARVADASNQTFPIQ